MSTYINPESGTGFSISTLDCPSWLKEYLNYIMVVKNLTTRTAVNYYTQIRDFLRWTQCRLNPKITGDEMREISIASLPFSVIEGIQTEDLYEYLSFSTTVLGNKAKSRAAKLSAIKGMFAYFSAQKRLPANPATSINTPKLERTLPKYLTVDQCVHMLRTVKETPVSDFPERDFCMLTFLLNCGLRVSELVGMDYSCIMDDGSVRIYGKGRKERIIYINAACIRALNAYLVERQLALGEYKEDALFISRRTRGRITSRRVEQIVEKMLLVSGLSGQGFSPHKLRHTAATLLYATGSADVLELQQILGHESTNTTSIYTHLSRERIREAMEGSPLAGL